MIVTFLQSFILKTSELPTTSHTFDDFVKILGDLQTLSSRDVIVDLAFGRMS